MLYSPMPSFEDGPISWALELILRVVGAWFGAIVLWSSIGLLAATALFLLLVYVID